MYRQAFGAAFHFIARVDFFKNVVWPDSFPYHGRLRPTHLKTLHLWLINADVISAGVGNRQMVSLGSKRQRVGIA